MLITHQPVSFCSATRYNQDGLHLTSSLVQLQVETLNLLIFIKRIIQILLPSSPPPPFPLSFVDICDNDNSAFDRANGSSCGMCCH
jgi:hypothetical protein